GESCGSVGVERRTFYFQEPSAEEIFRELGRWYALEEVTYFPPELKNTCFYLNTNRFEDVRTVLETLEKTNTLSFELENGRVRVRERQLLSN
ncbi:MAG: DUF4974 domain-containing protein, partial [Odoribacter sp.]|nr:DUF4974 domain-containing protein [Odoribacter sp.]